jgi:hypothetical protein
MSTTDSHNHWAEEIKKPSLKEPPFKSKFQWLKPITAFTRLEFKGNFF